MQIAQLDRAGTGLGLHVAVTNLLSVDAARAGIDAEAAMEPGGMDIAGAGAELGVSPTPSSLTSPEPEAAFK